MLKKIISFLLIMSLSLYLCGCWNYRGLNELSYVAGMAIDRDINSEVFKLTFELVDLSQPTKGTSLKPLMVQSEGKTIFDAIRNAKKRLEDKLYFGNDEIIIIGKNIVEIYGLNTVLDMLFRGSEIRETAHIVVSEGEAKDLLLVGEEKKVVSYLIHEIINDDKVTTSSINDIKLYQIFTLLLSKTKQNLVLPVFHIVKNADKKTVEANGIAVFDRDKVIGYLTPIETKHFLFIMNQLKGGVINFNITGGPTDDVTLEINHNTTKRSFTNAQNEIIVKMKIDTKTYLTELQSNVDVLDEKVIDSIEVKCGQKLKDEILETIKKVQTQYNSDIFGIGNMIDKSDPSLWTQLSKSWKILFKKLKFDLEVNIQIINTASRKKI